MRLNNIIVSSWCAISLVLGTGDLVEDRIQRRQDSSVSALPTLGSPNSQSATSTSVFSSSNTGTSRSITDSNTPSATASGSVAVTTNVNTNTTSSIAPTSASSTLPASTTSAAASATSSAAAATPVVLPLQPHITPALSIGGVVLILTGIVYGLIGVKNRWIHIFLSTAYLTSLSITVLIVYVMNPPVSNAIQGAYFVGILMTGIIFGAGALIFKEVTEGLGCMLGGFCLGMWFLTLKSGGLLTTTGGKAIFISAFCLVAWSLSFSHYTRSYGLIGSIAFSGATAFVLGIDCFSGGGLKEFWLYIWGLNTNIFPLNTNTYPITRGIRVELIVTVLACIIGVISQTRLWKTLKDKQKERTEAEADEERRREVVEAALGRHLERQNDRDRSQWEKQYGDRLTAKRDTILWTEAHGEKVAKITETELIGSHKSSSSESLEMTNIPRQSRSMYSVKSKHQIRTVTSPIPELEESDSSNKEQVRQQVLKQLEGGEISPRLDTDSNGRVIAKGVRSSRSADQLPTDSASREQHPEIRDSMGNVSQYHNESTEKRKSETQVYLSAPEEKRDSKRRSFVSFLSRSVKGDEDIRSMTQSQEALVVPEPAMHHSRASSLAATLDFENEDLEFPALDIDLADVNHNNMPEIVISPIGLPASFSGQTTVLEPELSEAGSGLDPEEFVRPMAIDAPQTTEEQISSDSRSKIKRQSGSEAGFQTPGGRSRANTSETTRSEILTRVALEAMPSQLSHIAMSYRTNEWAKHISTAEAPAFEEPETIVEGLDTEAPTHLADPTTIPTSKRTSVSQDAPPEIPLPLASAVSSATEGIRINPAIQPEKTIISAVVVPPQPSRVQSTSRATDVSKGIRNSSTSMLVQQTSQTPPFQQGARPELARQYSNTRSFSVQGGNHPTSHPALHKVGSRTSLASERGVVPQRSMTLLSNHQAVGPYQSGPYQAMAAVSDTRLQSYDSHQPVRSNTGYDSSRREAMLADWKAVSPRQPPIESKEDAVIYRQQMLMERQQKIMMEEQEKTYKYQQELANDARMRSKDMQELHREAMRKMQAGVNKTMKH